MRVTIKKPIQYRSWKYWIRRLFKRQPSHIEHRYKIRIDAHDTWDVGYILSHILVPLLKKYKELNIGTPVLDEMNEKETWDTLLDKMIWSFEQIRSEDWEEQYITINGDDGHIENYHVDREGIQEHYKQIEEGIRLFAKYYMHLWW